MDMFESPVERVIREAQERGEFDNLPGTGKPLGDLGSPDDPDWWVKGLIQREQLDMTGALPPALALRKEAATFPESLRELHTEEGVRTVLDDYNRRVRLDRLRPAEGNLPPLLAKTIDVDEMVEQWRELRADLDSKAEPAPESPPMESTRRSFWRSLRWWRADS